MSNALISQSAIELLVQTNPNALISQSAIELIVKLGVSCNNPPSGNIGKAYSHQFLYGGAPASSNVWSFSGTLPPGLSLNASTGLLSGVPTKAGTFAFTVILTNSGATASVNCSIVIGQVSIVVYGWKVYPKGQKCEPETTAEQKPRSMEWWGHQTRHKASL